MSLLQPLELPSVMQLPRSRPGALLKEAAARGKFARVQSTGTVELSETRSSSQRVHRAVGPKSKAKKERFLHSRVSIVELAHYTQR